MTRTRSVLTQEELQNTDNRVDTAAVVGQFLNQVELADIVVELVQNDLDQGATRTEITFAEDHMLAVGNGRPVTEAGWRRLQRVAGAGGEKEIQAKKDGIGSKNHGLRTLFLLGDVIVVRSGGFRTYQAIARPDGFIDPHYLRERTQDPDPVTQGCVIEVGYRTRTVRPRSPGSEIPTLLPTSPADIEAILGSLLDDGPWKLLGCIGPWNKRSPRYELVLRSHADPGPHRFVCESLRGKSRRTFGRRCTYTRPDSAVVVRREEVLSASAARPEDTRIAWPYKLPAGRVRVELAWQVGPQGRRVINEDGGDRYPLGYPQRRDENGFSFSAPFVSDTPRHGQAGGRDDANEPLNEALRELVPRAMKHAVKRSGPRAFDLLLAPDGTPDEDPLDECIQEGLVPVVGTGRWGPIIPASEEISGGQQRHSRTVATWLPKHYRQLDPRCPDWLRGYLIRYAAPFEWLVATELSLVQLLVPPEEAGVCGWRTDAEWRRFVGEPTSVARLLNVFRRLAAETRDSLDRSGVHFPNVGGVPTPIGDLVRAADPPPKIPGVKPPTLVHADLLDHPVLRKGPLAVPEFDESEYVLQLDAATCEEVGQATVFEWLMNHLSMLKAGAVRHLKTLPVWKTARGQYVPFALLCDPKAEKKSHSDLLRRILGPTLHLPHPRLRRHPRVRRGRGSLLAVSGKVTEIKLASWYQRKSREVLMGADRRIFESELVALSRVEGLEGRIRRTAAGHVTSAADGSIVRIGDLHLRPVGEAFGLLRQDIVDDSVPVALAKLLGVREAPSAEAVLRALTNDPRYALFEQRLEALFKKSTVEALRRARDARIIPAAPPLAPTQTALIKRAVKGDPWGGWRVRVDSERFSVKSRDRLTKLGAVTSQVTRERSVGFFRWLQGARRSPTKKQLSEVLRQWSRSTEGPAAWAGRHPPVCQ